MAFSILTNVPALTAARHLEQNLGGVSGTLASIATGERLQEPAQRETPPIAAASATEPGQNLDVTA